MYSVSGQYRTSDEYARRMALADALRTLADAYASTALYAELHAEQPEYSASFSSVTPPFPEAIAVHVTVTDAGETYRVYLNPIKP